MPTPLGLALHIETPCKLVCSATSANPKALTALMPLRCHKPTGPRCHEVVYESAVLAASTSAS